MKNIDEETLKIYAVKSLADKALNSLKGILVGINLDGEINEKEINELQKWVSDHNELIVRNPFNEFMQIIQETIEGDLPAKESIEDLYWLCQKYEYDSVYYNSVTSDLQILQGIFHGILSDGEIKDKEVFDLQKWLEENEHLNSYYPYDEIRSLVLTILADGHITEDEKLIFKAYLNQFVQIKDNQVRHAIDKETEKIQITGLCTSEPKVEFKDKLFCITGALKRGKRDDVVEQIVKLGGIYNDSLIKKTDYLIVGDNGNPVWAFACYGRKVEKAITMRKDGHTIMMIHEFDFLDILDDLA